MSGALPRFSPKSLEGLAKAVANLKDHEDREVIVQPKEVLRDEVVEQIAAHAISKLVVPAKPAKEKS